MNASKVKKIGIILLLLTYVILIGIWALNGYDDTWFYAVLILISASTSLSLFKKDKSQ